MESVPDIGTTVFFTIPFVKILPTRKFSATSLPIQVAAPDSAGQRPSDHGVRPLQDLSRIPRADLQILIAEDNEINQQVAKKYVRKLGFENAVLAVNGLKAVEAVRERACAGSPFHIILMDCQMPEMDGYDATRRIRRDPDPLVRNVIIVALTASATDGDKETCLAAGMNDYLSKPVKYKILQEALEKYLRQPHVEMHNLQEKAREAVQSAMETVKENPLSSDVAMEQMSRPEDGLKRQVSAFRSPALTHLENGASPILATGSSPSLADSEIANAPPQLDRNGSKTPTLAEPRSGN